MTTDFGSAALSNIPPLTLGWRLQMALDYAGVSVQEMADDLGMSRGSLSRWMNGRGVPPRKGLVKQWAFRTGVNVQWLLTGETEESHRPDGPADGFNDACAARDSNPEPAGSQLPETNRVISLGDRRDRRRRDRSLVAIAS